MHYVLGYNQLSIGGLGVSASSLSATTFPANAPDVPYDSEFLLRSNLKFIIYNGVCAINFIHMKLM